MGKDRFPALATGDGLTTQQEGDFRPSGYTEMVMGSWTRSLCMFDLFSGSFLS